MANNPFLGHQYVEARLRDQLQYFLATGAAISTTYEGVKRAQELYGDVSSIVQRIDDFARPQPGGGGHVTSGSGGNGDYDMSIVQPTAFSTPQRGFSAGYFSSPRATATKAPKRPRAAVGTNRRYYGAGSFRTLATKKRRKHKRSRYL